MHQLRGLTVELLAPDGSGAEPIFQRRYQETVAMLEVLVRVVQSFPEAAGAELRLCDGLEAMLAVASERIVRYRKAPPWPKASAG